MTNLPIANRYYFQRALRDIASTPPEVKATPTAENLTLNFLSRKALESEGAKGTVQRKEFRERAVGESGRRFDARRDLNLANLDMARDRLDTARLGLDIGRSQLDAAGKQNRWATGISLANLGITAGAGWANLKEADRMESMQMELLQGRTQLVKMEQDILDILKKSAVKKIGMYENAGE